MIVQPCSLCDIASGAVYNIPLLLMQYEILNCVCVTVAGGFIAMRPSGQLHAIRPPSGLMSKAVLGPLLFFAAYCAVMQVIAHVLLNQEQWYQGLVDKVCATSLSLSSSTCCI